MSPIDIHRDGPTEDIEENCMPQSCMVSMPPRTLTEHVQRAILERSPEELALGWVRYETMRSLYPRQLVEMHERNLRGEFYDDLVDEKTLERNSP